MTTCCDEFGRLTRDDVADLRHVPVGRSRRVFG